MKVYVAVHDKIDWLNSFYKHITSSGSLFESSSSVCLRPCSNVAMIGVLPFSFFIFAMKEVHKALNAVDA